MTLPDPTALLFFSAISFLTAALAVGLTARLLPSGSRTALLPRPLLALPHRYEFREGYLLSPLTSDDAFLSPDIDRAAAFDQLGRVLSELNSELPGRMRALKRRGEAFVLTGRLGPDALSVAGRSEDGRLVLTVCAEDGAAGRAAVDAVTLTALQAEAEDLRTALDVGPVAIWRQDGAGRIDWANAVYLALIDQVRAADADSDGSPAIGWPLAQIFGDQLSPLPADGSLRRCQLDPLAGTGPSWFEVSANRQPDGTVICVARPIDRLIAAEASRRSFVQTLSKTFATLSIGLAVFDRHRELVMFNPALVRLSALEPDLLSRRPSLPDFLDGLREAQRMPEPRDYREWRDAIAKVEEGAEAGTYQELWSLPNGDSLRVIGRPHPDGAVAFTFEDISREVSLTRKFRGDLELYQGILDAGPEAVAVFDQRGQMLITSQGYRALWDLAEEVDQNAMTLTDAVRLWQSRCRSTGLWGEIRQFALHQLERTAWADDVTLIDGGPLTCRVAPLPGGAMMVRFQPRADTMGWQAPYLGGDAAREGHRRMVAGLSEPDLPLFTGQAIGKR